MYDGKSYYGDEVTSHIETNGRLILEGTTVTGAVVINGALHATDADIYILTANGEVKLDGCTIRQSLLVNGMLSMNGSQLKGLCSVASEKICFIQSRAQDILIRKIEGRPVEQQLILSQGSEVAGTITFESGRGKVFLEQGSSLFGEVIGGEVLELASQ